MGLTNQFETWLRGPSGFDESCRREAYIARMDTARTAWQHDPAYGRELAEAASKDGHFWVQSHAALPLGFQILTRCVGFNNAQRVAKFLRR